jgi:hypothetical protein
MMILLEPRHTRVAPLAACNGTNASQLSKYLPRILAVT